MSECSLSGRGQGHVSNFYIVDLENFATASRRYAGDIHKSSVVGLFMTHLRQWKRLRRVMVECILPITHCLRLNLQLHTIDVVRTCRITSFCTVAWQLARFQLTRRIARSLGDSWASCLSPTRSFIPGLKPSFSANPSHRSLSFSSWGLTTWIPQTFSVTSEHIRFYFLLFLFYTF